MKKDITIIIEQFVDYLMPKLTPYEASLYIFFLRNSVIKKDKKEIRIGKRTIAENISSVRATTTNYAQVTKLVNGLAEKGCIEIGDTNRDGTLYTLVLPEDIPLVKERLAIKADPIEEDYFSDPEKRKEIFDRDKYICFYCGEKVTKENATLDHLIPQYKGGQHTKDNLKTSCLLCNSIKSGKTYDEAAPFLLKSIQERKARPNKEK